MGSKMVVAGGTLAAVARGVDELAGRVGWSVDLRYAAGGALGSPSVVTEFESTAGDQRRRSELLTESLRAVAGLARAAAAEVERVEAELEGAGRG